MARETFENWIPDEKGSKVLTEYASTSAVDQVATHEVMTSDVKQIPRDGGFTVGTVAKGSAYAESTATNDYVELTARKIGGADRIALEDLVDTTAGQGILTIKRQGAANALARSFDNAALGTTAVLNGTTVPYNSIYYLLTQNDAAVSYTANANLTLTAGALTYDDLNTALSQVETSTWTDPGSIVWIADPSFRALLRGLVDGDGRPLWQAAGQSGIAGGNIDTLLGYPVRWSRGARKHATMSKAPSGNPLLLVGDAKNLLVGDAALPGLPMGAMGTAVSREAGFLTDEIVMKAAVRRAFGVVNIGTWAAIEKTAS